MINAHNDLITVLHIDLNALCKASNSFAKKKKRSKLFTILGQKNIESVAQEYLQFFKNYIVIKNYVEICSLQPYIILI